MTDTIASAPTRAAVTRGGAFYRLVWKWHFLASLFVLPFMFMLSLTGGIYLFKPQIEEYLYADRLNVEIVGEMAPIAEQQAAVMAALPNAKIGSIKTEQTAGRATIFDVKVEGEKTLVWVNPYTAQVIDSQTRSSTAMQLLRKFHGELLLGKFGTKFVELSAHWGIVMIITGMYMWWPRGKRTWRTAFKLPSGSGRPWWRETHLFMGMLTFILITPLLITGLPWTDVWGGSFRVVQKEIGQNSPSLRFGGKPVLSSASSGTPISYEEVIATAKAQGIVAPYNIRPPKNAEATYWISSGSRNRFERKEMVIDQYTGEVLKTVAFADYPVIAKAVSLGIGFHQGELYGWLNIAQNVLAALVGMILSVSGFVAWWMRRPEGTIGVPAAPEAVLSKGMIVLIVVLSILLPLVGASLIVALILDWLLFRRLGWFQGPKTT